MATNNNVQNVKFLRNGALFNNHDAAYAALTSFTLTAEQDGTAILARYTAEDDNVKTLVGWVYSGASGSYVTIQDVEGASADVEELKEEILDILGEGVSSGAGETVSEQLAQLSGNTASTSADTSVEGAKRYADEKISGLDYTGVTTGDAVVVTNVTEADGIVAATTANVGGLKLTDYTKGSDSGAVAATDSINAAFSKVEKQIDAVNDVIGSLDYTDTAVTKQFVAAVDETDGVISVTRGELQSSGKTIVLTADGNDVNFEVNIDNDTLQKNENGVISVTSSALVQYEGDNDTIQIGAVSQGVRTVSSPLTIEKVTTGLSADVKEEYHLVGHSGNTIGDAIKIYKDSSLLSVALLHAELAPADPEVLPTYNKATDTWTDIPATAQTEANQALCYAYEDVSGNTIVAAVPVGSFINEQEFASGITWDTTANKVRGVVDNTSEEFLTVGADGFKLSGIQDAINNAVGTAVSGLDATVSAETANGHVSVQIDEVDGKLTAVTLTEDNIANADDLAELSGKTVTALTSTNGSITATPDYSIGCKTYDIETDASKIKMTSFTAAESGFTAITTASTVTEAVKAVETAFIDNEEAVANLDERLDIIEPIYLSGVSVNGSATTVSDHVATFTVASETSAMTASNGEAIVVNTDSNGNIKLGLATIDCGTY